MTDDAPDPPEVSDPVRFMAAIRRFDEENGCDPNVETVNGVARPRELVYAERLSDWVMKLAPAASEELDQIRCSSFAAEPGRLCWRSAGLTLQILSLSMPGPLVRSTAG